MNNDKSILNLFNDLHGESEMSEYSNSLPILYSSLFRFYSVSGGYPCLLIIPNNEDISFDELLSCFEYCIKNIQPKPVIYLYGRLLSYKDLLKMFRIEFIGSDNSYGEYQDIIRPSIYDADEIYKNSVYTKTTQLVIKFYLFNDIKGYTTRNIAKQLNINNASVSRANAFLSMIGAINKVGAGTHSFYIIKSKKDFFNKIEKHLILPYRRRFRLLLDQNDKTLDKIDCCLSGFNALSIYTDLLDSENRKEIALSIKDYSEIYRNRNNHVYKNQVVLYEVQEFIYDMNLFNKKGVIDLVDLYIIVSRRYKDTNDERIISAIRKIKEMIVN